MCFGKRWASALGAAAVLVGLSACAVDTDGEIAPAEAESGPSARAAQDISARGVAAGKAEAPYFLPAVGVILVNGQADGTGTLIAPRLVLTAGHMAKKVVPGRGNVSVEFTDTTGARHRRVAVDRKFAAHTCTEKSGYCDLGVIELDEPVLEITPLDVASDAPASGTVLTMVGYGAVDELNSGLGTKRRATVQVGDRFWFEDPDAANSAQTYQPEGFKLVQTSDGAMMCGGDSGGPVVDVYGRVVGVMVQSQLGCNTAGSKGWALAASRFASWIATTIVASVTEFDIASILTKLRNEPIFEGTALDREASKPADYLRLLHLLQTAKTST